jgi:hypothetical protein
LHPPATVLDPADDAEVAVDELRLALDERVDDVRVEDLFFGFVANRSGSRQFRQHRLARGKLLDRHCRLVVRVDASHLPAAVVNAYDASIRHHEGSGETHSTCR